MEEPSTSSAMSQAESESESESTSFETSLQHMPYQDIVVFGLSAELNVLNLPTIRDILKYYFFLSDQAKIEKQMFSHKIFTPRVADKLIEIWNKLNVELIERNNICRKLNALLDKYHLNIKHRKNSKQFRAFVNTLNVLFYIGKCKCALKTTECSCGLIPEHLKEFMMDQHKDRKLTIPEYMDDIVVPTTIPTAPTADDTTFQPYQSDMETDEVVNTTQEPAQVIPKNYTQRYDALNFAMVCDRFGVSDRVASCLATALFEDIDFRDDRGNLVVMDKSKVAREKSKSRDSVIRKRQTDSCIVAFSFDGKKDNSLTREKIDGKFHQNMVKEPHLVILKEPDAELLGYVNLGTEENAKAKHRKLNEFFSNKGLSIEQLIGICSDGEPANTGADNGVLRLFEKQLNRPLHWFICLLHFNELPFRHLYAALEKTVTSGPRSASGKLFNDIQECEKLQVCDSLIIIIKILI